MMSTSDRRLALRDYISECRHTSVPELMKHFDVSYSTVIRDLDAISEIASFYKTQGNGGGIHAVDGWYATRRYYTADQEAFLRKLEAGLQTDEDRKMMAGILRAFAIPKHNES